MPQPPNPTATFFLDRTHQGKKMVEFLKELGMSVEVHRDHFSQEEDDHLWIPICAGNGWVIISGDKGLEKAALNAQAVTESGAKVFVLTDNNMKGIEWAASIITGRHKMQKIVDDNNGPFFVTVGKGTEMHVGKPRFVGQGSPKPKQPVVATDALAAPAVPADPADSTSPDSPKLFD
jgi:hypothetical protein